MSKVNGLPCTKCGTSEWYKSGHCIQCRINKYYKIEPEYIEKEVVDPFKDYITKKEAASILGKTPATLTIWHNNGKFLADKIVGDTNKSLYYLEKNVEEQANINKLAKTKKLKNKIKTAKKDKDKLAKAKTKLLKKVNDSDTSIDVNASELAILANVSASYVAQLKARGEIKPIGVKGKTDLYDSDLALVIAKINNGTSTPQWVLDMRKERDENGYEPKHYGHNTGSKRFIWRK